MSLYEEKFDDEYNHGANYGNGEHALAKGRKHDTHCKCGKSRNWGNRRIDYGGNGHHGKGNVRYVVKKRAYSSVFDLTAYQHERSYPDQIGDRRRYKYVYPYVMHAGSHFHLFTVLVRGNGTDDGGAEREDYCQYYGLDSRGDKIK